MKAFVPCAAHACQLVAFRPPRASGVKSSKPSRHQRLSRRAFNLCTAAALTAALCDFRPSHAKDGQADVVEDIVPSPTVDLGNGIRAEDVSAGSGPTVEPGSEVSVRWVLRRANGYFIDASYGFGRFEALTYTAGTGAVIHAFETAVLGMRAGGRRRFTAPPEVGYVSGIQRGKPGPIPPDWGAQRSLAAHLKEPLVFEIHVIRVKPPRP